MTDLSSVKITLANIKGIQASFSKLALTSTNPLAKKIFHECMMETEQIAEELTLRVEYMKMEE